MARRSSSVMPKYSPVGTPPAKYSRAVGSFVAIPLESCSLTRGPLGLGSGRRRVQADVRKPDGTFEGQWSSMYLLTKSSNSANDLQVCSTPRDGLIAQVSGVGSSALAA